MEYLGTYQENINREGVAFTPTLTPDPRYRMPTPEEVREVSALRRAEGMTEAAVDEWWADRFEEREKLIWQAKTDPLRHGYVPVHWADARGLLQEPGVTSLLISGGNRSSKSAFSAFEVVGRMLEKRKARMACFSMTEKTSIRDRQAAVWAYLPVEYRQMRKKKQGTAYISYTQMNGFSNGSFVLPNGSQCWFMNYAQNPDVLEGLEADFIWFDELVPYSMVEAAKFRLVTRRGQLLIACTPVTGWTPTVNAFVAGSKVRATKPARLLDAGKVHVPGCPKGEMPYIADCVKDDSRVIWFHTDMNPFQPKDSMDQTLQGESSVTVELRAYGWCEKLSGGWFPKFGKAHVVKPERVPKEGTNYMVVDPAGARNWTALWLRVCKEGLWWVYREWPDRRTYGEWALPGDRPEGDMGPAQKPEGRGLKEYKELFEEMEAGEVITERLIDPRAGGTAAATEDGGETLIDLLAHEPNPMWFIPAPGLRLEQGIAAMNDAMDYDLTEPLSVVNQPRLLVSEDCGNLIDCLHNVTDAGADKNRWKDFADCLRYLATYGPEHRDGRGTTARGGGSY